MERLLQDLRFGARLLWKDRAFAVTALLTLAVCIGANATIFAVVNSVLLRPLPVDGADRLVLIYNSYPRAGVIRAANGVPDYYDRLREVDAFEEQALYNTRGLTIGIDGDPQRVTGMMARPSLLRMLHVQPIRGRIFTDDEGEEGNDRKVVLTYELWQQIYAGRDSAVGEALRINGVPYAIVGVLPQGFHFLDPDVKMWIPLSFDAEEKSDDSRHSNNWSMVGRLKPGATVQQAQQQLDALNARNLERFPNFREILINAGFHTVASPLQEDLVSSVRRTLYLLWGGVLFVLLIGVVNITNLVLVRSSARARELATRHALGAAISRITSQMLTETALLTAIGGLGGLALGYWGLTLLTGMGLDVPRASEIRVDVTVVLFTLGLALAVGLLVGIVPVLNVRHINLSQAFREESRSGMTGRGARTVRRLLVASQVAFAFMLLIGAGLLLTSFQRVIAIDPGFEPRGVLTARIAPPASRYPEAVAVRTFRDRLLERVRALPGVRHAGTTSSIPFGDDYSDSVILAEGYQMAPGESLISPYRVHISPGYFESMGVSARRGRLFTSSDTDTAPRVVIVDERLARRFWANQDPVGRRMFRPDNPNDLVKPGARARWYTVVGVVPEIRISGLVATDDRVGAYYFPVAQEPQGGGFVLVAKTDGEPESLVPGVRRELAAIDPELPLYSVLSMEHRMERSLVDRRTPMMLTVVFAGVALFLAAIGIYGVLAYQVSQRSREIGIRMALGSDASGIFRLVLGEGVALLAAGFFVGIVGAFALRRSVQTLLYGVGAMDPLVLLSVASVLALVALTACAVPALRAARIDPSTALNTQ